MLMEVSGETFTYDRTGEWLISSLTTEIQDGEAVTSALMRQPLGAGPMSCAAFLPYADEIVDCAFEAHDDLLCAPRQLANVVRINLDEAIGYFDDFLPPGWQARGVAPLELKELCRRQGRSFYFLNGHRMLDSFEPPVKKQTAASCRVNQLGRPRIPVRERSGRLHEAPGELWTVGARASGERVALRTPTDCRMEAVGGDAIPWLPL